MEDDEGEPPLGGPSDNRSPADERSSNDDQSHRNGDEDTGADGESSPHREGESTGTADSNTAGEQQTETGEDTAEEDNTGQVVAKGDAADDAEDGRGHDGTHEAPLSAQETTESADARGPPTQTATEQNEVPDPRSNPIAWYLNSTNGWVIASRDVIVTIGAVALIGVVLFAITGVWPPLVAVESGSMEPNMKQGDLVLIVDNERFTHPDAHEATGILTTEVGEEAGHESFGEPGNVIVFRGDGGGGTPIIHRAKHHVERGENWYDRSYPRSTRGIDSCDGMPPSACPAPHDGFVTQGDANDGYDQIEGQSAVVREEWIQGKAVARVPWLGCIRLELTSDKSCTNGRNSR